MGEYYVYALAYPDGTVFYVGKGTKDRIDNHEDDAKRADKPHLSNTPKSKIIQQIWHNGGKVLKRKVAFFEYEDDAYRFEQQFIASLDKDQLINCSRHRMGPRTGLAKWQCPTGDTPVNLRKNYKKVQIDSIEQRGETVAITLDCGHVYTTDPVKDLGEPLEQFVRSLRKRIGQWQRCILCKK